MAMRAATMNSMNPVDVTAGTRESDSLLRKLVLLLLLIIASGLWIVLLFKRAGNFPLFLSTFFADTTLGLIAGFGTRFVLRQQSRYVRWLVAILAAVIGMLLLGSLSHAVLGVGPIRFDPNLARQIRDMRLGDMPNEIGSLQIDARRLFDLSKMDWADPLHLGISLLMVVLSLQAWPSAPISVTEPVEIVPLPVSSPAVTPRRERRSTGSSNGRARVKPAGSGRARVKSGATPGTRSRSNNGSRASVLRDAKKKKDSVVRPKRKRSSQKAHIQFALVEEHRCPYCLETVTRNDPRGVKECEVCHTLHHADCWAITGMCQVPHLNT